ncbi:hypothetical protein IB211_00760c [Intestinimonas butyriciproducens]|uniref:Uncharacterized protein n=1 Tax=Intestinimonas butyriciproducens TaxID=1297617 RepID=A0A0S2W1C5_9FIRM|nr:hypothetical protein IB211_00760c [Intestinimonas butyriciproducens]QBB66660.1 hypothetical protein SRB521_02402 [Intestinimonas butyriciproducens]
MQVHRSRPAFCWEKGEENSIPVGIWFVFILIPYGTILHPVK